MKYALIALLLIAPVFAQEPPSPEPASPSSAAIPTDAQSTEKARMIIDQAIVALGGPSYLKVQSFRQQGRSYSFHHGEAKGAGVFYTRVGKLWDKDRIDYTASHEIDADIIFGIEIPMGTAKTHVTLLYTRDKGYEVTNYGVRNMDDKDFAPYMRRRHFAIEVVMRQWPTQPGVALFYEGRTIAAQKETDQVTIMNAKNEAVTLNFDVASHLPVKKSFSWRDPADKQRNVEEEIYDNYRPVQNVMTPFDVTRTFNGEMSAQSFLTTASYNEDLSDTLFEPKAAPPPEKKHR